MNKQEARKQSLEAFERGKDEYLFNCDWKRIFKAYYLDVQHKFSESYLGEVTILEECKAVAALRDLCDRYINASAKERASGVKRYSDERPSTTGGKLTSPTKAQLDFLLWLIQQTKTDPERYYVDRMTRRQAQDAIDQLSVGVDVKKWEG